MQYPQVPFQLYCLGGSSGWVGSQISIKLNLCHGQLLHLEVTPVHLKCIAGMKCVCSLHRSLSGVLATRIWCTCNAYLVYFQHVALCYLVYSQHFAVQSLHCTMSGSVSNCTEQFELQSPKSRWKGRCKDRHRGIFWQLNSTAGIFYLDFWTNRKLRIISIDQ